MLCPIQRWRYWGESRKLLWTPALYDQYYHRNGPHSATYSIAPLTARIHTSQISLTARWVRVCVCKASGLWWVFVIEVAGYATRGRRQRGSEELSCKLWHDSSPNLEGRSNAGDWQICRDKASCQSPASVARHRYQPPPPFIPEGACRQDGGDPKYHSSSTLDKPNICFVKTRGFLYSFSSFWLSRPDWFFSTNDGITVFVFHVSDSCTRDRDWQETPQDLWLFSRGRFRIFVTGISFTNGSCYFLGWLIYLTILEFCRAFGFFWRDSGDDQYPGCCEWQAHPQWVWMWFEFIIIII